MNLNQAAKPLVIGIGNRDRGDDQVGIRVVELIQRRMDATVDALIHRSDPAYLIDQWQGRDLVIAIDAVVSDDTPEGEICCWDAANEELAVETYHASTHMLGIHDAIELAKALHKMPHRFYVFGINAGAFAAGQDMSDLVRTSAEKVAAEIVQLLKGDHDT